MGRLHSAIGIGRIALGNQGPGFASKRIKTLEPFSRRRIDKFSIDIVLMLLHKLNPPPICRIVSGVHGPHEWRRDQRHG